jgi:hypothetical protein
VIEMTKATKKRPLRGVRLLRATLEHIKADPKHWNQQRWKCRSSYCFGGWAIILGGEHLIDGEYASVDYWRLARKFLGISRVQAGYLFYVGNTLRDLEKQVKSIISKKRAH